MRLLKSVDTILKDLQRTLNDLDKLIDDRTAKVSKNMAVMAWIEQENKAALTEAKMAGRVRAEISGLIAPDDESASN